MYMTSLVSDLLWPYIHGYTSNAHWICFSFSLSLLNTHTTHTHSSNLEGCSLHLCSSDLLHWVWQLCRWWNPRQQSNWLCTHCDPGLPRNAHEGHPDSVCGFCGLWDLPSKGNWEHRRAEGWEEHLQTRQVSWKTDQHAHTAHNCGKYTKC